LIFGGRRRIYALVSRFRAGAVASFQRFRPTSYFENILSKPVRSNSAWKRRRAGFARAHGPRPARFEEYHFVTDTTFAELGVAEPLLRALAAENYTAPTPIQAQAIAPLLAGRDLLGIAQTGTGKTAAFALPILQHLAATRENPGPRGVRALILAPTRELAIQISQSFKAYGRHLQIRGAVVIGGVGIHGQAQALGRGVDILVATPGRLLDLVNSKAVRLDKITHLVLDEADRMLDMGFIRDVRKIVASVPKARQSLLFSATMPPEVAKLAAEMMRDPLRVEVTPQVVTVEAVDQRVFFVDQPQKPALLARLLADPRLARVIVFTRTKHGANRVAERLDKDGVGAEAIHGNKSQGARQRALEAFRSGRARVLVATDIAARGIDVDGVTHVVNYDLPNEPESYVHRIGRTARAGAKGVALAFCAPDERPYLRDIERLTRRPILVESYEPLPRLAAPERREAPRPVAPQRARPQNNRGRRRHRR
jgi:ATP-dependent RNA helicase RhlE